MSEHNFPIDFIKQINSQLGESEGEKLMEALDRGPSVAVRFNPAKRIERETTPPFDFPSSSEEGWRVSDGVVSYSDSSFARMGGGGINPVPWCADAIYLDERPQFTLDPRLHGGGYYVQEASSMIVGAIAELYQPQRILDLCAAPGGKSTHLAAVLSNGGVLVANEVIKSRAAILQENVIKWGLGNVVVTSSDAVRFGALAGMFDMVVVDAPCSGEGMFRKDVGARGEWSLDNVELCAGRSRRIVSDVWNGLSDGGVMIYSTCTFNRSENEDTVAWICEQLGGVVEGVDWSALGAIGVVDNGFGGHFYPHKIKGEGLFCAVIRKTSACDYGMMNKGGRPLAKVVKADVVELDRWVGAKLDYRVGGGNVYGYRGGVLEVVEGLLGSVNVVYSGVEMGNLIRGELKPAHPLALYYDVCAGVVSDLDIDEALLFLRKGTLDVRQYAAGLSMVRFDGLGLGWAKSIGTRVNNNYPQNWRILK